MKKNYPEEEGKIYRLPTLSKQAPYPWTTMMTTSVIIAGDMCGKIPILLLFMQERREYGNKPFVVVAAKGMKKCDNYGDEKWDIF